MAKGDYKERIVRLLRKNPQHLDVEKIRIACGIGNWQTALKHCLELLYDGRIQGVKSSKSWIFWIDFPERNINPAKMTRWPRMR